MKMLRVVLAVSNFLEAPNGGGAGGNQQPAGPSSLCERCDGRGNNPHAAAKDSRAVSLRTREYLAEPIASGTNRNVMVRPKATGSPKRTGLQPTAADLPGRPPRPPQRRCPTIPTVGWRKRGPAICGGCESREEATN